MSASHPFHIFWHNLLPSTNNKLKELAKKETLMEYTVICTHDQTAGKGQIGNSWESQAHKNLTFSLLLKPTYVKIQDQFIISKAVALGILKAFEKYSDNCYVKWPNDIYFKNKKIGGILIENSIYNNTISESIIGIGLNINQTSFISNAPNPISLKAITGLNYNLNNVLLEVLESIHYYINQIKQNQTKKIDSLYLKNLFRNKGDYLFKDFNGYFHASINNITEYGHLELKTKDGGLKSYAFKEVEFIIEDLDNDN